MKNSIKTGIISTAIATMPLNVDANSFEKKQDILKNQANVELSMALNNPDVIESMNLYIPPKVVVKAMLDYFDEEVKKYRLSASARSQIVSILTYYFSTHNIFNIHSNGRMELVIDDKKDFAMMVKRVVNIVIDDMPFLIRKIGIPLFFGGNDALQEKLDNLDATLMNMKEKQYKDIVLDYIAGIVKRIAITMNGKFTVGEYYDDISHYYPNRNGKHIKDGLNNSGQINTDIKNYKYQK